MMDSRADRRASPARTLVHTTTDRPADIRLALGERGIVEVFKGDQNQAWDAVLANHCLQRAVGDAVDTTFFVQDEKLGTPDAILSRMWREQGRSYALTEDYFRGRKGAVWEHQDVSYGPLFTEAVSPGQFAAAAVHLPRTIALWGELGGAARQDARFAAVMDSLGAPLDLGQADASTRLGPAVNAADMAAVFAQHPDAELSYVLTRTTGLYGVVPALNDDVLVSSIPAGDRELRALGSWLLVQAAARGAMRAAGDRQQRRAVGRRARELCAWVNDFVAGHPGASVADFQAALGRKLQQDAFPEDRVSLTQTSVFMRLDSEMEDRLREPDETLFYILDLALRHPREFTEAYNEALNRAGFGLQRARYDAATGEYHPPFFAQFAPGGPGTPTYRYGLRLEGEEHERIVLVNRSAGRVEVDAPGGVWSARDLARALVRGLGQRSPIAVVGKAATFMAELRRWPRALGLPRQGSKYAPMVDLLTGGLHDRGVLPRQDALLVRIGLNALDRLGALEDARLRLPSFLHGPLGRETTAAEFARRWRSVAEEAEAQLTALRRAEFGQHVHLLRLLALNARGEPLERAAAADAKLRRLLQRLGSDPAAGAVLSGLGRDLSPEAVSWIGDQLQRRSELLAVRRERRAATDPSVEAERKLVEYRMLLVYAAWVRRVWQRARSLQYVNDRPYTLAFYLLFGPEFFRLICRNVEFDLEYSTDRTTVPCAR